MPDEIILVDEQDIQLGVGEKMAVHQSGKLHRAFSIFIFNESGQLLLQQRSAHKYHSAGLWSNTCCGHPRPEESILDAAQRRLREEMGFRCALTEAFTFIYETSLQNGLIEHEFDHVLVGIYDGNFEPNQEEVAAYKWVELLWLKNDLVVNSSLYTYWLRAIFGKVLEYSLQRI